jgi:hypothetical protein
MPEEVYEEAPPEEAPPEEAYEEAPPEEAPPEEAYEEEAYEEEAYEEATEGPPLIELADVYGTALPGGSIPGLPGVPSMPGVRDFLWCCHLRGGHLWDCAPALGALSVLAPALRAVQSDAAGWGALRRPLGEMLRAGVQIADRHLVQRTPSPGDVAGLFDALRQRGMAAARAQAERGRALGQQRAQQALERARSSRSPAVRAAVQLVAALTDDELR